MGAIGEKTWWKRNRAGKRKSKNAMTTSRTLNYRGGKLFYLHNEGSTARGARQKLDSRMAEAIHQGAKKDSQKKGESNLEGREAQKREVAGSSYRRKTRH